MNLKTLCFNIWKDKYTRKGISQEYKPYFIRFVGIPESINSTQYASIVKTLYEKSNSCEYSLFFDNEIPFQPDFNVIQYIGKELETMDVTNLKSQDIVLFEDSTLNSIFLNSLDTVVNLAISQENFKNNSVRNDFILKLITWTFTYIRPLSAHFNDNNSPKVFYYGDITRHEIYFLMMLYLMTFDVVFLNTLRDNAWSEVDTLQLSEIELSNNIQQIIPLRTLIQNANVIEQETSATLQMQNEIDNNLYTNSGVYRPWQFIDGYTKSKFIKGTIYDLNSNYKEPAKVRNGFEINNDVVIVPNLFYQIDGVDNDYVKLCNMCFNTPNTLILNLDSDDDMTLFMKPFNVSNEEMLKLTFCQLSDGSYNISKIKQLPYYTWSPLRDSLEDLLLNKINETLKDSLLFRCTLSQEAQLQFIACILSLKDEVIQLIDSFDFTEKVPKIVIFCENKYFFKENDPNLFILGYLNEIGIDIVILNPSGMGSMDDVISKDRFNEVRLEEMNYNLTMSQLQEDIKKLNKPKGFFARLFGD